MCATIGGITETLGPSIQDQGGTIYFVGFVVTLMDFCNVEVDYASRNRGQLILRRGWDEGGENSISRDESHDARDQHLGNQWIEITAANFQLINTLVFEVGT